MAFWNCWEYLYVTYVIICICTHTLWALSNKVFKLPTCVAISVLPFRSKAIFFVVPLWIAVGEPEILRLRQDERCEELISCFRSGKQMPDKAFNICVVGKHNFSSRSKNRTFVLDAIWHHSWKFQDQLITETVGRLRNAHGICLQPN